MIRKLSGLLILFFITLVSFGTHNLAGEITYRHISGLTYEFTFNIYADGNSRAIDRREIEVDWGDNSPIDSITLTSQTQIATNPFPIVKRVWRVTHTFPGSKLYTISVEDPNRNANVINMSNSINVPFTIETQLLVPPLSNIINNSVQLRNDPIDRACAGIPFIYNPGAFDPDGLDSLAYSLAASKQARGVNAPNFSFPQASNSFSINPSSGDLIWNTPIQSGLYNVGILITEYRRLSPNGPPVKMGSVLRDIQISVQGNCDNTPPSIFADDLICIEAGNRLVTLISSSDSDVGDLVTLEASGELLESPFNLRTNFVVQNENNPVSTNFSWNTQCSDVRKKNYEVNLRAEDNANSRGSVNLVNFKTIDIRVISPGPTNATAQASGNAIQLSWQNPNCPNADGYYIYRRLDSSGFVSSNCIPGVPDGIGYTRIAEITDVNITNYTDDNGDKSGLVPGQKYCYLITKFYADRDESYASNEVCAEIEKIKPVITNVSITTTAENNGVVELAWSPPNAFDTIAFPKPYNYLIFENEQNTEVATTNSINDTTLQLTNRNTLQEQFSYRIALVSLGNGREIVGTSTLANSIFLEVSASDERNELTWTDETPWINTRYDIFRKIDSQTGFFDSISSTSSNNFTDLNLTNGVNYCYYIRTVGDYSLNSVASPIINLSQTACAEPVDNISPCSPEFNLESSCDDGKMRLSWQNVANSCAPDVSFYKIFFAANNGPEKELLFKIPRNADTFYLAPKDSVGGCFSVVAVDSTGNESDFTDFKCAEYCPVYELPNVFTPNNDGINDLFTPIKPYQYVDSIQLYIYNRWGELVFSTNDPNINWNGEHQNIRGKEIRNNLNLNNSVVNSGVFFYVCEVYELSLEPKDPRIIKGTLTVLDSQTIQRKQ